MHMAFLCSVKLNHCKSGSLCTYTTNVCTYKANVRSHLMQFWSELHTYTHTQPSPLAYPPSVLFGTLLHPSSQHILLCLFLLVFVLFCFLVTCLAWVGMGLFTGSGATPLKKSDSSLVSSSSPICAGMLTCLILLDLVWVIGAAVR